MFGCGIFPAVVSLSMPFLSSTSDTIAHTTIETVTPIPTASSVAENSCPKPEDSAGMIAGSVIGGRGGDGVYVTAQGGTDAAAVRQHAVIVH
jgi:hypothetical protein